jgi:anaerobic selenocysteine-containing dehydrogenase
VQFRPTVVAPRGEARADIDIVFDLAVRLGLGEYFWHGDVEAALDHHLAPSGLSIELLRANPRGIRVPLQTSYEKYRNGAFATPSGRIEIFSTVLRAGGDVPIPEFRVPFAQTEGFPLTLTTVKTPLYCHSQHRNLAKLRRVEPHPIAELNPLTAGSYSIGEGDWLAIATPHGQARARARFNETLADGVVAARHGWWQPCPDLDLPGYDALGSDGANINLTIGVDTADPVSGAASHRCYPCRIYKLN